VRHGLAVVLLVVAVTGAVARPWRLPAWVAPAAAAAVALLAGSVTLHETRLTLRPLAAPLAFVGLAVPLAIMLDEVGVFEELARRAARTPKVVGACWLLAACVVALLNLDAAVVLLTPLYVRTARRVGLDPVMLAFQPVLLAMLASSVLPVSNLTNLIAASRLSLTSTDFLAHLALPSMLASTVGWFAYRRLFPARPVIGADDGVADDRALAVGGCAIALFLVVLVSGERVGVPAWAAALITIGFVVLFTRRVPWRQVPLGTVVLAGALSIVAAGAARAFPHALASAGDGGARGFATGAVAGNVLNNLPATLVTLPHVAHVTRLWPLLFGLNAGPALLVTGSLAGLLWQASARASGVSVTAGQFSRVGAIVGVPAMAAGLGLLLVVR
jgi:arsenical pump membrane protein